MRLGRLRPRWPGQVALAPAPVADVTYYVTWRSAVRPLFWLGATRPRAFVGEVLIGVYAAPATDPFWGYPPWLVVLGLTLAAALAIWILGKLLKWALWLLLIAVLVGGVGWAIWLLIR